MLDILKLKGKVAENNLNITLLAKEIGMNRDTLYRRIANSGENLTLKDIKNISGVLKLNKKDITEIFMNM
ncbi:MAG: XRE family transcriptional regulator [Peptoniphilaceae bacterium]|uniref:XRE family transcriptional regulator n=1 Tax=Peptoniphilus sp. TaxID=1971214 RepID=UPI001C3AA022|nr:XRE family transcriptional regulator [Peptoniphilus sp.]MDD7352456.1 XRE family transcriptional regulator [Peptoniphilaceae bacterium]MDY3902425.1 XRE family transcriptional regulator [Peptoniphilus sp.]CAG7586403.1 hypothetical protein PEPTYR26121_00331 [Peptoniphilus tyrrelliae]